MPNNTRISKLENGLAGRIPQVLAKEARLAEGDYLSLSVAGDGSIVLRSFLRKYQLRDLVGKITPQNRHGETDWRKLEGRE
jgi:antitoxin MazE